jgi:hypothetical protein
MFKSYQSKYIYLGNDEMDNISKFIQFRLIF